MNDWDDLRFFLALAQTGSLSMAARLLAVNHSTVSRRIATLEERYGVRLFDRQPTGVMLTPAGALILEYAEEIDLKYKAVDRLIHGQDYRLSGPLSITMPHDLACFCVIPFLEEFSAEYPEIELKLLLGTSLKDLNAREADIAIRLTASPPQHLVGTKVAALRHGVYQSTQYSPNADGSEKVIIWNHEIEKPFWVASHFPSARVALRVDDLSSMYAAVRAGLGIARMPCYFPDAIRADDIKRRDMILPNSSWGVWILSHTDLRTTARVGAFRKFLKQMLEKQIDLFEGLQSVYIDL
ncbi:MAG: LysR family transcriptional regulator [Chitinivorax sp.]